MPSLPIFPVLKGREWPTKRTPHFGTRKQRGIAGRELRIADQPNPVWEWAISHSVLRDKHDVRTGAGPGPGHGLDELRTLMGLYVDTHGSFGPFVFYDPTDSVGTVQFLGVGDGVTTNFSFLRRLTATSTFYEPMNTVSLFNDATLNTALGFTVPGPLVYLNGVLKTFGTDYGFYNTFQNTDSQWGSGIIFAAPPGVGVAVTSTFTFLFTCRFSEDSADFENFLYQLWSQQGLKFRSLL